MAYIGEIGKRLSLSLKLEKQYSFSQCFGWKTTETTIYTFTDAEGNTLIWKTSGILGLESINERGDCQFDGVRKGDSFKCKATVKEHSEYKGTEQTVLTRLKVESIDHVPTQEELNERKADEQMASITGKDFLWEMPYKQYKEHYSDCETLAGSFHRHDYEGATITVIIREGRLVPSGVRGKHYSGYEFADELGRKVCYRAVSEETAKRRLLKDYPQGAAWECVKIYNYRKGF